MSILDKNSKKMLVESMRSHLGHILKESTTLSAAQATEKCKFLNENATYEQLLNITLNPRRSEKYLPDYVLEGAIAVLHSACLTGRKNIGKNAIVEGSLRLSKKIGAIITESMMDAALTMVNEGCGLEIVGDLMKKVQVVTEATTPYRGTLGAFGITDDALLGRVRDAFISRTQLDPADIATIKTAAGSRGDILTNELSRRIAAGDSRGFRNEVMGWLRPDARLRAQRVLDTTAPNALSPAELRRLERRVNGMPGRFGGSRINSNAINTTVDQLAKRGRMNPLVAAGLGAAALGGGMLAYKKYKDRQNAAMEG